MIPHEVVSALAWTLAVDEDADLTGYRSNGWTRAAYERRATRLLDAALKGFRVVKHEGRDSDCAICGGTGHVHDEFPHRCGCVAENDNPTGKEART